MLKFRIKDPSLRLFEEIVLPNVHNVHKDRIRISIIRTHFNQEESGNELQPFPKECKASFPSIGHLLLTAVQITLLLSTR